MNCLLCNKNTAHPVSFRQLYKQDGTAPVELTWYGCKSCRGLFNYPPPTPAQIGSYWKTVSYNDPALEKKYLENKKVIYDKILTLAGIPANGKTLLDYGSNFGQFLDMARDKGMKTYGFEPFKPAADISTGKGHTTFSDFDIASIADKGLQFDVITANDSFCYVWNPYDTLVNFYRLLRPGGKLIMRVSNKRTIIALADKFESDQDKKNRIVSKILQAQFHSISVKSLARICREIGFDDTSISIGARTAPLSEQSFKTNISYLMSSVLYYISFGLVNISPGVILIATKKST